MKSQSCTGTYAAEVEDGLLGMPPVLVEEVEAVMVLVFLTAHQRVPQCEHAKPLTLALFNLEGRRGSKDLLLIGCIDEIDDIAFTTRISLQLTEHVIADLPIRYSG